MEGKVTALRVQARNKERVNVYLDGRYAFGLAKIEAARLKIGQHLSQADIDRLEAADEVEAAHERALRLLSHRPRTETELRRHLRKREQDPAVIEAVLERLRRAGLADDQAFGRFWVENRMHFRPKSQRAIKAELRQKGLSAEAAEAVLAETHGGDEAAAYQAAAARARKMTGLPRDEFFRKLGGFLGRRGFRYETSKATVEQIWRELVEQHPELDLKRESED